MNIKEISEKLGLSFLNEAEPSKEVEGGYCGDLLSFVMSHAKCGDCWLPLWGTSMPWRWRCCLIVRR